MNPTTLLAEPIATAPMNGTVILTDEGYAQYVDQRNWGCSVTNGWYVSSPWGDIQSCADDGMFISRVQPTMWVPSPILELRSEK